MLLYALILVVKSVIRAGARVSGEEARHFVLVKIELAGISVVVLVIIIKYTAFARTGRNRFVFAHHRASFGDFSACIIPKR